LAQGGTPQVLSLSQKKLQHSPEVMQGKPSGLQIFSEQVLVLGSQMSEQHSNEFTHGASFSLQATPPQEPSVHWLPQQSSFDAQGTPFGAQQACRLQVPNPEVNPQHCSAKAQGSPGGWQMGAISRHSLALRQPSRHLNAVKSLSHSARASSLAPSRRVST
jgi:hypothetical protein